MRWSLIRRLSLLLLAVCLVILPQVGSCGPQPLMNSASRTFAQAAIPGAQGDTIDQAPNLITQASVVVFMALLPFLVVLLTSYIKTTIVMSLLRNALGVQQAPPNTVINGLALILAVYVMYPTGLKMYQAAESVINTNVPTQLVSADSAAYLYRVIDSAREPLRNFLIKNSSASHLQGFFKLAAKTFPAEVKNSLSQNDFLIVIPSFITTQIRDAFEIGVLIYLPFFIIDLVVSNILLAMGMMMLSPLTISLPLKLLLIVMIDGWTILIQGLVLTFNR